MIGTRLDTVDAPRLLRSRFGWWFIGNQTWTLIRPDSVSDDGVLQDDVQDFLHSSGACRPVVPKCFSLTVLTATNCNLGCGYCFQNTALDPTGGHRPIRIPRNFLSNDTIERLITFTAARMAEAELSELYLLLFGGEPLLNRRGCINLLDAARDIGLVSAMAATNGVLLDLEFARRLEAHGLTGVQITFDGSRKDHDSIRVTHSGEGTFDLIVHNVAQAMKATNLQWHFRINVSDRNFHGVPDLFAQLLEAKIDPKRCTLTFAWVGDAGFGYENRLQQIDVVSDALVAWSIAAIEAGFRLVRPSMKTTCQICSIPGGKYGAVVNADGALYSCWQSAGKAGFDVGTVEDGYKPTPEVAGRWVTCGYEYSQPVGADMDAFHDRVDQGVLDYLYTSSRL